jgi:tetratricopeptide (TPR) repeat protein
MVGNEFEEPLLVDHALFSRLFGVGVRSMNGPVAVVVEWPPVVRLSGESWRTPININPTEMVRIEGEQTVTRTVDLRRADGERFSPGVYRVDLVMINALGAVRTDEDKAWTGPLASEAGDITVIVNTPTSRQERVRQAVTAGRVASDEGDVRGATQAYERAVQLDPTDPGNKLLLASTYLGLKRYRDAIPFYEDVVRDVRSGMRRLLVEALAQAYLGAGDEQGAVRVLQAEGVGGQALTAKLAELRGYLRKRR